MAGWNRRLNGGGEYYYAGSQRVVLWVGTTLSYLFNDQLGSTSITADAGGNLSGELRYLPIPRPRIIQPISKILVR